jgi:hypothetical protein
MPRRSLLSVLAGSQSPPAAAPADTDFAAFAESIELGLVSLYNQTIAKLTADNVAVASRFRDHHQDHATAYAALAASKATGKPNSALLFATGATLQAVTDQVSALAFLIGLENEMAETYTYALGTLVTPDVYQRVVTTLPVESEHAAVLGSMTDLPAAGLFITGPFENASVGDGTDTRRGFDPAVFPVG